MTHNKGNFAFKWLDNCEYSNLFPYHTILVTQHGFNMLVRINDQFWLQIRRRITHTT